MVTYRRLGRNIRDSRLSQLAPYVQKVIRKMQRQGMSVAETETQYTSRVQLVFYAGPFLVNVYHLQSHRRHRTFAELDKDRISQFAYSLFFQEVPGFKERVFYVPTSVLMVYIGPKKKRQITLPLNDVSLPVKGMPPDFTWLLYEGKKGLELMKSAAETLSSAINRA
ncbi:MAG: hypothetical protein HY617_00620 [Candidatus Sungbacteria bacterium]|nr:hypothetical protein [Candidatus Sungbacteria bacterium]